MAETKTAPKTEAPTLTLGVIKRPKVDINGKLYEMRSPNELTRPRYKAVMGALHKGSTGPDPEFTAEEIDAHIDRQFDLMGEAVDECMFEFPKEVNESLSLGDMITLVEHFFKLGRNDNRSS